jgi:hypothetical protein
MEKITAKFDKVLNTSPFPENVEYAPDANKKLVSIIFSILVLANPVFSG